MVAGIQTEPAGMIQEQNISKETEWIVPRTKFTELLKQKGAQLIEPQIDADTRHRHERNFFITNNPGIHSRWNFTPIQKDQPLAPNLKIKFMERLAGIVPFVKVIPVDTQQMFESALSGMIPPGFSAKMQGVIMQEEYSYLKLPDITGIKKHSLDYPRVEIHIYDPQGEFAETLVLNFIDKPTQNRIIKINDALATLSPEKLDSLQTEIDFAFASLDANGVADKLVTNEYSVGYMAQRTGLSKLDIMEGIISHGSFIRYLEYLDPLSKSIHLSSDQRVVLASIQKLMPNNKMKPEGRFMPKATEVVDRALQMAQAQEQPDSSVIMGLRELVNNLKSGKNHYYHNAVRIEGLDRIFGNGEQTNIDKLGRILASGKLLPREGTFTKGEYLAGVDFGKDHLPNMLPLMFEEPADENPEIVMIFEVAKKPIPQFKHEACSLTYVPIDLKTCFKRLIVTDQHRQIAQQYLEKYGYKNIEVISYESWLKEIAYIHTAQQELIPDTLPKKMNGIQMKPLSTIPEMEKY